jgi:hypothetical protein
VVHSPNSIGWRGVIEAEVFKEEFLDKTGAPHYTKTNLNEG